MKKLWSVVFFLMIVLSLPGTVLAEEEGLNLPAYLPDIKMPETMEVIELEEGDVFWERPVYYSEVNTEDDSPMPIEQYYGYQLLLKEKEDYALAYRQMLDGLRQQAERVDMMGVDLERDEVVKIYRACFHDHPELFYLSHVSEMGYLKENGNTVATCITPVYYENMQTETAAKTFETWAESVIDKSGVKPWMSDYDKALMLHDELAVRIVYHEEFSEALKISDATLRQETLDALEAKYPTVHTAYGALVEGKAVCDGYAKAYQYLLQKMGISSHMTPGRAGSGGHAWNLVQLDDKWYYTDLTWDDQDEIFYDYFNMTYNQLVDSGHVIEADYTLPTPDHTEHNYFVRNGSVMTADRMNLDNIVEQLKKNSYARIYIQGETVNKNGVWQWYQENVGEIARQAGIGEGFSYSLLSKTQREIHLRLLHDTVYPKKNLAVEIGSKSDREAEIVVGYYDENDVLLALDTISRTLQENTIVLIKAKNPKVEYSKIRYFVWDGVRTLGPLYRPGEMEYQK